MSKEDESSSGAISADAAVYASPKPIPSDKNLEKLPSRADWAIVALTCVTAVAAIIASLFSGLQWWESYTGARTAAVQASAARVLAAASLEQAKSASALVAQASRSADAAKQSAASAGEQLEEMREEQRPRIFIENTVIDGPLIFLDGRAIITLRFDLRNSGRADAEYAYPFGEFFMRDPNIVGTMSRQSKFCKQIRSRVISINSTGRTISSNQLVPIRRYFVMSALEVEKWKSRVSDGGRAPVIAGCIDYIFEKTHHQTTFVYELDRAGTPEHPFLAVDPLKGDEPASELILPINSGLAGRSD